MDPLRAWALPCAFAVALGDPVPAEDETGKKRLKLDIDKRVEAALDRDADTPRFEEHVDVEGQTPEELLARFTRQPIRSRATRILRALVAGRRLTPPGAA